MFAFRVVGIVTILVVHAAALSLPFGGSGSGGVVKRIINSGLFERSGNDDGGDKAAASSSVMVLANSNNNGTKSISSTIGEIPFGLSSSSGSITPVATPPPVPTITGASTPQGNSPASVDPKLVPPAVDTVCDGKKGIPQSVNKTPFFNVTITAGDCPPVKPNPRPSITSKLLRPQAGCNYPPNICSSFPGGGNILGFAQCGAQCNSDCYFGSGGPDPNDCEKIFNYFRTRPDKIFQVGPNKFLLFTYGTCGTAIQNQIGNQGQDCNTSIIYDYPDWGNVGSYLAWNCQGNQGARGGKCQNPANNFYIQVYRN
jgi:hypothetical protein